MGRLFLSFTLLLVLAAPARAERIDGPSDGSLESLVERALPIVSTKYLHPDAADPAEMAREGIQALEAEAPSILVTEGDEGRMVVRVGSSERTFDTSDVTSLEDLGERLGEVVDWLDEAYEPEPRRDAPDFQVTVLSGALKVIDRHSRVISGDGLAEFNTRYQGTLTGIGARIGRRRGAVRIIRPFADAPAGRAGLIAGDAVTHVDGIATSAMNVTDVVALIRGPEGVPVLLTVEREGEEGRRVFVMMREKVLVPSVESARMPGDVGWIKIDHFSKKTSLEFQQHLDGLRKEGGNPSGLVIDLRGNTGGSMIHAARIVNAFTEEGRLLRTEGRDGGKVRGLTHTIDAKPEFKRFDGPVVVLVDGRTASGSEIVAGGLKYTDRGLVLGTQTFGKGTVQKLYKLEERKSMKLTVARYLLPGDAFINSVGVTPDIIVGEFYLDPRTPASPDLLREPARLQGRKEGKGGLDAKRNPGAGREPTATGTNARPALRLVHARVTGEWGSGAASHADHPSSDASHEGVPGPEEETWTLADPEGEGEPEGFISLQPGDDGDDRFNDMELRLAYELLSAVGPDARRAELIEAAGPLVDSWQTRQSTRMAQAFAARNLRWGVEGSGAWMDRAPADEPARQDAMLGDPPPIEATLEFVGELGAEEATKMALEVVNTSGRPLAHLRGLLQSSSSALDDRTFLIGDLEPGGRATWTLPVEPGPRAASRLDAWRLYLIGDDGPLGGPFQGVVPTRGLPRPRFHVQTQTTSTSAEDGGISVVARFSVRNDGPGDAGEVRVTFGDPNDVNVERVEQFAAIDELLVGQTGDTELTLRVRNPDAVVDIPIRARVSDRRTGATQILRLVLPVTVPLEAGAPQRPADVQFTAPTEAAIADGRIEATGPYSLAGEVTSDVGLERVEIFVGRDKVFVADRDPADDRPPQTLEFSAEIPLAVGPNRVTVRSTTERGHESSRVVWLLGL